VKDPADVVSECAFMEYDDGVSTFFEESGIRFRTKMPGGVSRGSSSSFLLVCGFP